MQDVVSQYCVLPPGVIEVTGGIAVLASFGGTWDPTESPWACTSDGTILEMELTDLSKMQPPQPLVWSDAERRTLHERHEPLSVLDDLKTGRRSFIDYRRHVSCNSRAIPHANLFKQGKARDVSRLIMNPGHTSLPEYTYDTLATELLAYQHNTSAERELPYRDISTDPATAEAWTTLRTNHTRGWFLRIMQGIGLKQQANRRRRRGDIAVKLCTTMVLLEGKEGDDKWHLWAYDWNGWTQHNRNARAIKLVLGHNLNSETMFIHGLIIIQTGVVGMLAYTNRDRGKTVIIYIDDKLVYRWVCVKKPIEYVNEKLVLLDGDYRGLAEVLTPQDRCKAPMHNKWKFKFNPDGPNGQSPLDGSVQHMRPYPRPAGNAEWLYTASHNTGLNVNEVMARVAKSLYDQHRAFHQFRCAQQSRLARTL